MSSENEGRPSGYSIVEGEKGPLNTNNGYQRLSCGPGSLPQTNPPTRAKW